MDRFTKEEANVLTTAGFASFCHSLRNSMTYERAYEATEAVHQRVHGNGDRKYSDFSSFQRVSTRLKQKAPTS